MEKSSHEDLGRGVQTKRVREMSGWIDEVSENQRWREVDKTDKADKTDKRERTTQTTDRISSLSVTVV